MSTVTMVRLGRTYAGLIVSVTPGNDKLRARARRNLMLASGAAEGGVDAALDAAGGNARIALVSLLARRIRALERHASRSKARAASVRLTLGST